MNAEKLTTAARNALTTLEGLVESDLIPASEVSKDSAPSRPRSGPREGPGPLRRPARLVGAVRGARARRLHYRERESRFPGISLYADILQVSREDLPWAPDLILASPPCTWFSVMNIGKNWTRDHQPKTDGARLGLRLVEKTREIISWFPGARFVIENPRAKLRKLPVVENLERRTVTYCQYGETRMKPTDLWGNFPAAWVELPLCKKGMPCHVAAPRGSATGTQGMDSAASAKIPRLLALSICQAMEVEAIRD